MSRVGGPWIVLMLWKAWGRDTNGARPCKFLTMSPISFLRQCRGYPFCQPQGIFSSKAALIVMAAAFSSVSGCSSSQDRKSVVKVKEMSVRLYIGGRRILKK